MRIGFTGTQVGLSAAQKKRLATMLRGVAAMGCRVIEFHHGDCIGADAEAHDLVRQYMPTAIIHVHPPSDPKKRAWRQGDVMHEEKSYLVRNRDIVDSTEILIGMPQGPEVLRSGTWSTIRYSARRNRPCVIIYP